MISISITLQSCIWDGFAVCTKIRVCTDFVIPTVSRLYGNTTIRIIITSPCEATLLNAYMFELDN